MAHEQTENENSLEVNQVSILKESTAVEHIHIIGNRNWPLVSLKAFSATNESLEQVQKRSLEKITKLYSDDLFNPLVDDAHFYEARHLLSSERRIHDLHSYSELLSIRYSPDCTDNVKDVPIYSPSGIVRYKPAAAFSPGLLVFLEKDRLQFEPKGILGRFSTTSQPARLVLNSRDPDLSDYALYGILVGQSSTEVLLRRIAAARTLVDEHLEDAGVFTVDAAFFSFISRMVERHFRAIAGLLDVKQACLEAIELLFQAACNPADGRKIATPLGMISEGSTYTEFDTLARLVQGRKIETVSSYREGAIPVLSNFGTRGWTHLQENSGPGIVLGRVGKEMRVHFSAGPFANDSSSVRVEAKEPRDIPYLYGYLKSVQEIYWGSLQRTNSLLPLREMPLLLSSEATRSRFNELCRPILQHLLAVERGTLRLEDSALRTAVEMSRTDYWYSKSNKRLRAFVAALRRELGEIAGVALEQGCGQEMS